MRLDRGHKVVTWIDVSGWSGLTGIMWNIAGSMGQNADAPRGVTCRHPLAGRDYVPVVPIRISRPTRPQSGLIPSHRTHGKSVWNLLAPTPLKHLD